MNGNKRHFGTSIVDLSTQAGVLHLFPAGQFNARDGRPGNGKSWRIDKSIARRVIAAATRRQTPFVIDYEHQTLNTEKNGLPAPAAGWFKRLEWRDGKGLYAVDVKWTSKARTMINCMEYRYISPVFSYKANGDVLELHMAALTNYPALDGMEYLAAARFNLACDDETEISECALSVCQALGVSIEDYKQTLRQSNDDRFCNTFGLSETAISCCRQLGISPEDYNKTLTSQ